MNISGWLKPMFGDRKSHLIEKPGLLAKTKCGIYLNSRFLQYPAGEQCPKCVK